MGAYQRLSGVVKLTDAQTRMLTNIASGVAAGTGFPPSKRSSGTAANVVMALLRRGLIVATDAETGPAFALTDAGCAALAASKAK